jgi:hypothetical protein
MPFKDKERQKEYHKQYRLKNKEQIKNKDKLRKKKYFENNTEKESIRRRKQNWKQQGLIDSDNDNYEKINHRWLNTTNCDLCNVILTNDKSETNKEMEHDHKTGLFRNVVCHICNIKIRDKEAICRSNTGIKNITLYHEKYYKYSKTVDKKNVTKHFKELDDAICYSVINYMILQLEKNTNE